MSATIRKANRAKRPKMGRHVPNVALPALSIRIVIYNRLGEGSAMHDALTIGILVLVILFGILFNQRGLDKLEARLDGRMNGFEGRMDRLGERIDRVNADLTSRLDRMQSDINSRFDRLQSDLGGRLDRMQADLGMFHRTIGEHGADIQHLKQNKSA